MAGELISFFSTNTPLSGCPAIYLSTHLPKNILLASEFGQFSDPVTFNPFQEAVLLRSHPGRNRKGAPCSLPPTPALCRVLNAGGEFSQESEWVCVHSPCERCMNAVSASRSMSLALVWARAGATWAQCPSPGVETSGWHSHPPPPCPAGLLPLPLPALL